LAKGATIKALGAVHAKVVQTQATQTNVVVNANPLTRRSGRIAGNRSTKTAVTIAEANGTNKYCAFAAVGACSQLPGNPTKKADPAKSKRKLKKRSGQD
jgi:hypothetical protein